jgi:hypothetical protein
MEADCPEIFCYYLRNFIVERWTLLELSRSTCDVGRKWMSPTLKILVQKHVPEKKIQK